MGQTMSQPDDPWIVVSDPRLRLTIVGGFLGAGKSTWLSSLVDERGQDVVVIVNDLGDVVPDAALMGNGSDVRVLAGGCACCTNLDGLIELLRAVCELRHGANDVGVSGVFLETSGLADPAHIVAGIQADPVLVRNLNLEEIVVVFDAVQGLHDLRGELHARRQVESADRIVVTKADVASVEQLRTVVATLHRSYPGIELGVANSGVSHPVPAYSAGDAVDIDPIDVPRAHEPVACSIPLGGSDLWAVLTIWLGALFHAYDGRILRVKALIPTAAGLLLLQATRGIILPPQVLDRRLGQQERCELVLVVRDIDPEALKRSFRAFSNIY